MYLPMAGLVDKEKERARLEKQAGKLTKDMEVLEKRLSGSNFVEKVFTCIGYSVTKSSNASTVEASAFCGGGRNEASKRV